MVNSIVYEKLNSSTDLNEVLDGLCYNFAKYEPMGKILNLERSDLIFIFEPILKYCASTSFVARDTLNKKIAGAIICNDFDFFMNFDGQGFNVKSEPIKHMISLLEESFIKSCYFEGNKTYYQYATFVNNDYGNQGIATDLYKVSQKYAFEKNYKNVFTISTGPISQHIRIKKLDFVIVDEIDYKKFKFNDSCVFAQITQVDTCKCLVKTFS